MFTTLLYHNSLQTAANVSPVAQFSDEGVYMVSNRAGLSAGDRSHK